MSEQPDPLQERLDRAFATTRPRRGFEDELWSRIQARRSRWARFMESARRVNLGPALAGLAVLLVVVLGGGLLLHGRPGASGGASTAGGLGQQRSGPNVVQRGAPANAELQTFGPLPQPPQPSTGYTGPVTVTGLAAPPDVRGRLPVTRYREWNAGQADAFAAGVGASPAGPVPPAALGRYSGADFTLVLYPTDLAAGTEPRLVLTPTAGAPRAAGSDDASITAAVVTYLSRFGVAPGPNVAGPSIDRSGGLVHVRWDLSPLRQGWTATLGADLSIQMVEAPLPLSAEVATYPASSANGKVPIAGTTGGPGVDLDTAELVYVVASDGTYGYFEPVIRYSGHFTQGGVTYEKQILVLAVR